MWIVCYTLEWVPHLALHCHWWHCREFQESGGSYRYPIGRLIFLKKASIPLVTKSSWHCPWISSTAIVTRLEGCSVPDCSLRAFAIKLLVVDATMGSKKLSGTSSSFKYQWWKSIFSNEFSQCGFWNCFISNCIGMEGFQKFLFISGSRYGKRSLDPVLHNHIP